MARLHKVEKSREVRKAGKGRPKCGKCGAEIAVGQPYYWWKSRMKNMRNGRLFVRCADHRPRPSEMAFGYRATILAAQEAISDATVGDEWELSDLAQALRDAAENVRSECVEVMRENADNMESAFNGSNRKAGELRDRADAMEFWAAELDQAADEIDGMELTDCTHEADMDAEGHDREACEVEGCEQCETLDRWEDEHAECISDDEATREAAADRAEHASSGCPE